MSDSLGPLDFGIPNFLALCYQPEFAQTHVFFFFFFLLTLIMGICGGSAGRESTCNAGDPGSIPGSGRFPGEGKGYPLQYSGLQLSMDCIVISNSNFQ